MHDQTIVICDLACELAVEDVCICRCGGVNHGIAISPEARVKAIVEEIIPPGVLSEITESEVLGLLEIV